MKKMSCNMKKFRRKTEINPWKGQACMMKIKIYIFKIGITCIKCDVIKSTFLKMSRPHKHVCTENAVLNELNGFSKKIPRFFRGNLVLVAICVIVSGAKNSNMCLLCLIHCREVCDGYKISAPPISCGFPGKSCSPDTLNTEQSCTDYQENTTR